MEASIKVPDGKMVKLKLKEEDGKIADAEVRGDFFLEPPEKLAELEKSLESLKVDAEIEEVKEKLEDVEAKLIGFSRSDIAEAFVQAVQGGRE